MNSLSDSLHNLLNTIARWIPQLIGALIVLLVGYFITKTIEKLIRATLKKARFDELLHRGTAGSYIERVISSPSRLLGSVIFWLLWIGTLAIATTVLGIPALTSFVYAIYGYVPNVVAALLIFVVAGAVSTAAAALVGKLMGDTSTGKLVATVVPVVTMLIATFMILNQLQIAPAIVTITYTALMGAVALGMALAFGLGGREVAARILEQAYEAGREGAKQGKRDILLAKHRGEAEIHNRSTQNNPLES
jgi:hypothetical protein